MIRNMLVRVTGDASSLRGTLLSATAEIESAGRKWDASVGRSTAVMKAAGAAGAAMGVAIATGLTAATVGAAQFEQRMRNVNSIAKLSETGLRGTSAAVLELSRTVPRSANDLAEGLYQVQSSGFDTADGLTVLAASAKAASAGMTTTETAAGAIAATINAYGLSAKDATDVSDVLFSVVDKGVISFEQLGQFIGAVIGTAAAAKIPVDQLGAAIAALTLTGQTPEVAFNGLNNLIRKLVSPTSQLLAVYRSLGYESGEAAVAQRGLAGVIEDLQRVTGGSVSGLQTLLADAEAVRTVTALGANNGAAYARVLGEITDKGTRAGATQRAFDEQMKSTTAQLQQARNEAASYGIALGSRVLPSIAALARGARSAIGPTFEAIDGGLDAIAPALVLVGRIGVDVGKILGTLFEAAGDVAGPLLTLGGRAVIGGLTALLQLLESLTSVLADNPALVLAVAGVIAGVYLPAMVRAGIATSVTATRAAYLSTQLRLASLGITGFASATRASMAIVSGSTRAAVASAGGFAALAGSLGWVLALGAIAYAWGKVSQVQAEATESAQRYADVDLLDPGAVSRARATLEDLRRQGEEVVTLTERSSRPGSLNGFLDPTGGPFDKLLDKIGLGNDDLDAYWDAITGAGKVEQGRAADKALETLSKQAENTSGNVARLARESQLSETSIRSLAAANDVDLSKPWADSTAEVKRLREAINDTAEEAGTNATVLERIATASGDASAEGIARVADAVAALQDATRQALASAQDVLGNFDPNAGVDALASASKAGDKARAELADLEATYAGMTVLPASAAAKLADARARVAEAEADEAKASKARQAATLEGGYADAIAQASQFSADLTTVLERGLDPAVVSKLLQEGPAQAGPILQQMVADHSGALIELVNTSEQTLSELSAYTVEQARLTALAVAAPTDALARDLPAAMRIAQSAMRDGLNAADIAEALGASENEVRRIAKEFGITLGNSVAAGMTETLARLAPIRAAVDPGGSGAASGSANRTRGSLGGVVAAATGGYITGPGTTTSDSILARLSNREFVMKAAAVERYGLRFMHDVNNGRLPGFASGGYAGDAATARRGSAWNHGGVRTVVVPVTQTHTSSAPIHVENLYSADVADFEVQAARRRRLASLSTPSAS